MKNYFRRIFVFLAFSGIAVSASAMELDYTLGTGNGTIHGVGAGNMIEYVDQSVELNVSAWANLDSDIFQVSTVSQFASGLGACNPDEGTLLACSASSTKYQVDNRRAGQQDWLLLFLSETVSFDQVLIDALGNHDKDVTYWVGNLSHSADLSGTAFGDLAGLGMGNAQTVFNPSGSGPLSIELGGQMGNALLIGTRLGDKDDAFLLSYLTATVVPIPSAVWLLGSALGLLAMRRRISFTDPQKQ